MNTLKKFLFRKYSTMLAFLISILGMSNSCEKSTIGDPGGGIRPMYGIISATHYTIKGKITSSETNKAIKNIQVISGNDTCYTNCLGKYELDFTEYYSTEKTLIIKDIDGTENGEFEDTSVIVEFNSDSNSSSQIKAEKDIRMNPV
jgi:putative lipoprotein (rSAM/lipoprotein system)